MLRSPRLRGALAGALLVLVAIPALAQDAASDAEMAAAVARLEAYRQEVERARTAAQRALDEVAGPAAAAGVPLHPSLGSPPSLAGAGAGLYAGQLKAIDDWIVALRNHGVVDGEFLSRVDDAMRVWRARNAEFAGALAAAGAAIRERRLAMVPGCEGSETSRCNDARRQAQAARVDAESRITSAADLLARPGPRVAFDGPPPPKVACTDQPAVGVRLDPGRLSAIVNESIQVSVIAVGRDTRAATVDVATRVEIVVEGAEVSPSVVTIPRGACTTPPARITPKRGGATRVRARAEKLGPAEVVVEGCMTGPIERMSLGMLSGDSLAADGQTPAVFKLKFLDKDGATTTGRRKKELALAYEGAARGAGADSVAREECASVRSMTSTDVGPAVVKVTYGRQAPETARFTFGYPLTWVTLAWAASGALIGFLIRLRRGPARLPLRVLDSLLGGLVAAVVMYGILRLWMPLPAPAHYWTSAIALAAVVGGVLGVPGVWNAIERRLPGPRAGD